VFDGLDKKIGKITLIFPRSYRGVTDVQLIDAQITLPDVTEEGQEVKS
jgi:hypothetical protein